MTSPAETEVHQVRYTTYFVGGTNLFYFKYGTEALAEIVANWNAQITEEQRVGLRVKDYLAFEVAHLIANGVCIALNSTISMGAGDDHIPQIVYVNLARIDYYWFEEEESADAEPTHSDDSAIPANE